MLKRIAKIESYGFECIAGPLELCVGWIELKDNVKNILAENDRLTAKLGFYDNKCPVCNSTLGLLHADACPLCAARKEVERLQKHIEADAELYAALEESHRAVNEQLRIEGQRAARHLADQELLVGQERKRVARECVEMCEPWGAADRIRTRYVVEE